MLVFHVDLAWNDSNVSYFCLLECTLFLQETILEKTADLAAKQDLDQASVTDWLHAVADFEPEQERAFKFRSCDSV